LLKSIFVVPTHPKGCYPHPIQFHKPTPQRVPREKKNKRKIEKKNKRKKESKNQREEEGRRERERERREKVLIFTTVSIGFFNTNFNMSSNSNMISQLISIPSLEISNLKEINPFLYQ
jgi:hypothetical protein